MLSGTVRAMLMLCVGVDVHDQLAQVGGTNRVQTRVGLVAENDLRVKDQGTR